MIGKICIHISDTYTKPNKVMSNNRLLLRTNPKLTGNVKICVDSDDKIYLNAIDANPSLAQSSYQKKQVSPNSSYANDLNSLFNGYLTPTEAIFEVGREASDMSVPKEIKYQYEKQYEYGFNGNQSSLYSEQFSIFAPLFIGDSGKLPAKFVIFRMDGPLPYQPYIEDGTPLIIGVKYTVSGTGSININGTLYKDGQSFNAPVTSFKRNGDVSLYLDDASLEYKMLTSRSYLYSQIVDKAQIVKVIDLSADGSNIGRYLDRHVSDPLYNNKFFNVNFAAQTVGYNGIDIDSGVICEKTEGISSFISSDADILLFDEYVTNGWERNRMVSHRILNLEFLFNDTSVDDYKFYRYYGLYVNDVDFAQFHLKEANWHVTTDYRNRYVNSDVIPYGYNKKITDDDGIKILADSLDVDYVGHIDYDLMHTSVSPEVQAISGPYTVTGVGPVGIGSVVVTCNDFRTGTLSSVILGVYIKSYSDTEATIARGITDSINSRQHITRFTATYNGGVSFSVIAPVGSGSTYNSPLDINTTLTIGGVGAPIITPIYQSWYGGVDKVITETDPDMLCYVKDANHKIHKIQNSKCTPDTLCLLDKSVDLSDLFGFTDTIEEPASKTKTAGKSSNSITVNGVVPIGTKIYLYKQNDLMAIIVADTLAVVPGFGPGMSMGFYFHPGGTTYQIAKAMKQAFQYVISGLLIKVDAVSNRVFLQHIETGYRNNVYRLEIITTPLSLDSNMVLFSEYFRGGTDYAGNRMIVKSPAIDNISPKSFISCDNGFVRVGDVALYLEEPILTDTGDASSFTNIDSYRIITVNHPNQHIKVSASGKVVLNKLRRLAYGVFDVVSIGDFDFTTRQSIYTKSYQNEYYKYYHSQSLKVGDEYVVVKLDDDPNAASIEHDGVTYTYTGGSPVSFTSTKVSFTVVSGNPIVVNKKYQNDEELIKFIGFNSISRLQDTNISILNTNDIINKEIIIRDTGTLTEYDRLQENNKSYLALKSKIVPVINKWGLMNGNDVRENPYRFNMSPSFGEMGFTPSHADYKQDPLYFTHEWCYLGGVPELMSDLALYNSYSYLFKPFDKTLAKDSLFDYFKDYFETDFNYLYNSYATPGSSTDGYLPGYRIINRPVSRKYSVFEKADDGKYTTFFRGARLMLQPKDGTDYTGYKFSAVVNFVNTAIYVPRKPVTLELIENANFKCITLVVEVLIDDYKSVSNFYGTDITFTEYMHLYTMDSLRRWNPGSSSYLYGLEFPYPVIPGASLYLDGGGSYPTTTFRGIQLYGKTDYIGYTGSADALNFTGFNEGILVPDELKLAIDHTYGKLVGMNDSLFLAISSQNGTISSTQFWVENDSTIFQPTEKTVILQPSGLFVVNVPGSTAGINISPVLLNALYPLSLATWFAEGGGNNIYQLAAKLTSFASISECINKDVYIKHTTVHNDIESDGNNFALSALLPDTIITSSYFTTQKSIIEYPQLPHVPVFDYTNVPVNVQSTYYRYSGVYEPIIKDVVKFGSYKDANRWSNNDQTWASSSTYWTNLNLPATTVNLVDGEWKSESVIFEDIAINNEYIKLPLYKKDRDLNIKLILDAEDSGVLSEYYYHKVADTNIITLTSNPVFRSINEICIDSMNKSIFEPSLSPIYYRKYIDNTAFVGTDGVMSLYEDKAFFNGKQLKVPNTIVITNPTYVLDASLKPDTALTDDNIHYTIDSNNNLYIAFRHKSILADTIYANSIEQFKKYFRYFKNGGLAAAAMQYITNNITIDFGEPKINLYFRDNPLNTQSIVTHQNNQTKLQLLRAEYTNMNTMNIKKSDTQVFISTTLKPLHKFDMILDLEFTLGDS